jgi:hypothetical protein
VRSNHSGLASAVFDQLGFEPTAIPNAIADDRILHVFHGKRTGRIVVRNGTVRLRSEDPSIFHAGIRAELVAMLGESFSACVLLSGRVVPAASSQGLQIRTPQPGAPRQGLRRGGIADIIAGNPLLLLVGDGFEMGQLARHRCHSLLGTQVIVGSDLRPDQVEIIEHMMPPDHGGERVPLSSEEAITSAVGSVLSFGRDPVGGVDLLLDRLRDCDRFFVLGSTGSGARHGAVSSSGSDLQELDLPQEGEAEHGSQEETEGQRYGEVARDLGRCPIADPRLIFRKLDTKWLVVNPYTAETVLLDEQARRILDVLDGATPLRAIAEIAVEIFGGDRNDTTRKLDELVHIFEWAGLAMYPLASREQEQDAAVPILAAGEID